MLKVLWGLVSPIKDTDDLVYPTHIYSNYLKHVSMADAAHTLMLFL